MAKRAAFSTILLLALVGLSWHGGLDRYASAESDNLLTQALTAFTIARTLNAGISAVQGTEIALQPAGVGVTLTPGEALDPLNDLIERFSGLMLIALGSIGTQMLLAEVFASIFVNVAVSVAAALTIIEMWRPKLIPGSAWIIRLCGAVLLARFLFALVLLANAGFTELFLAERQEQAFAVLQATSEAVSEATVEPGEEVSMLDRLTGFADQLDLKASIESLAERAEVAIGEVVNLIVVFVVQTLVVPAGTLWLAWWCMRSYVAQTVNTGRSAALEPQTGA